MKKPKQEQAVNHQCPLCGAMYDQHSPAVPSQYLAGLRMALGMIEARRKALGGKLSEFEGWQSLAWVEGALTYEIEIQEKVGKPLKKRRTKKA